MKHFRKVLLLLLSAALVLSCAACGNSDDENTDIKTVVVGTNASHAPYAYHITVDGVDTIAGSDIDLAKKIADEAGYNLEIKDFSYDELLKQLDLGNLDFIVATMPNLKDNEDVLCSKSYGEDMLTCLTTGASYADAAALSGKTVGILEGTTQTELDALKLPENVTIHTQASDDLIMDLQMGYVDAAIMPQALADSYAAHNDSLTVAFTVSAGSMHVVVRYTNNIFMETVNGIIQDINKTRDMENWLAQASQNAMGFQSNENALMNQED